MKIIEKKTIKKSFFLAIITGIILGIIFYKFLNYDIFFIFLIVFLIGYIWVKSINFFYKNIFFGAPPVHLNLSEREMILHEFKIKNIIKVIDLGSGNGDVCFTMADHGVEIYGIELDIFFYLLACIKNVFKKNKVNFIFGNFWNISLKDYDGLIIYPISYIMDGLEKKIKREVKHDCFIVTYYFKFKTITPYKSSNNLYFYKI